MAINTPTAYELDGARNSSTEMSYDDYMYFLLYLFSNFFDY